MRQASIAAGRAFGVDVPAVDEDRRGAGKAEALRLLLRRHLVLDDFDREVAPGQHRRDQLARLRVRRAARPEEELDTHLMR